MFLKWHKVRHVIGMTSAVRGGVRALSTVQPAHLCTQMRASWMDLQDPFAPTVVGRQSQQLT